MGRARIKKEVIITILEKLKPTDFSLLDYTKLVKELKKLGGLL